MQATGIVKDFPGLRALDNVDLTVGAGEIVALVGHNGSGKSTLVKILAGVYSADAGEIQFADFGTEAVALHVIHQDLGLVAELSAVENLDIVGTVPAFGLAPTRRRQERKRARELLARFGDPFAITAPLGTLAPAQRSVVAIARALDGWTHARNVLILDEPTEALHANEVDILFSAVRRVAEQGAGIVFISHRLDEVLAIADRIVVLRDGKKVADVPAEGLDHGNLVEFVTGAGVQAQEPPARGSDLGRTVLDIRGLTGASVREIDIRVRAGEVVGVAGVLGSGRASLPGLIFGATQADSEHFEFDGASYRRRTPAESVRRGMAFVPGDRVRLGSIPAMSARENLTLPELRSLTGPGGVLRSRRERKVARDLLVRYDVRPPNAEQRLGRFSGGNQQKLVFAKWLRNEPSLLLLDEPTQGVDIGAKQAIYEEIDAAARRGIAVLVASSDEKELLRLCDRVIVLREGEVVSELSGERLTEAELVHQGHGLSRDAAVGDDKGSAT